MFFVSLYLLTLIIHLLAGPVRAQEMFVDVGVEIEPVSTPIHEVIITVTNLGTLPAYDIDVTVVVDPFGKDGDLSGRNSPGPPLYTATRNLFRTWRIQRLDAGAEATDRFVPFAATGPISSHAGVYEWTAEVSTASREDPQRKHNNQARAWQYITTIPAKYGEVRPDYSLTVRVDNHFPATDGSGMVNFTLTARNEGESTPEQIFADASVSIAFTPDLTPGTPMFAIGDTLDTRQQSYSNGMWHIGEVGDHPGLFTMTLPVTVADGAVLKEQCVTAELSARPPAGIGERYDDGSDNRARVCLGESEPVLFQSGDVELWTPYPCVGNTRYPCTTANTVEVATTAFVEGGRQIIKSSPEQVNIFIYVDSVTGRILDDQTHSVTDANTVSWQTAREPDHRSGNKSVPGVTIGYTRRQYNDEITNWTSTVRTVSVSGVIDPAASDQTCDAGDPSPPCAPGRIKIRFPRSGTAYYDPNPSHERVPLNLTSTSTTFVKYFAEFSALGTYVVDFTTDVLHTDGNTYSGTHRSIFHVGPLANLEVRSGPPALDVTGPHLVIEALNHGPDAPRARIPLDFLDPANIVEVIPSEGYYNESERAWYLPRHQNVGDFRTTGYRSSAGQPSAATLTIRTRGLTGNPTQPVTIASYQDYQVCIASDGTDLAHTDQSTCEADTTNGGSWHTTPYYDYQPANNEAQLTLHTSPRRSTEMTAIERDGAVGFRWTAQDTAETYGLEVSTDGETWAHLASGLTDTGLRYTGLLPAGQTRHYRVYSVNAGGERSAPFAMARTTSGSGSGGGTRVVVVSGGTRTVEISPTGPRRVTATSRGPTGILVYWSGPPHLYGEPVTSYELEMSHDQDHWQTVAPYVEHAASTRNGDQPATKYIHTGLTPGTTYYYRVYAHNRRGRSLASPVVAATTDEPRSLTGYLDHPRPQAALSGVGAVYGWECDADEVVVHINGTPHPAVTGLDRSDTLRVCGDTDNGFELLLNWNALGDGLHDIVVLVDGTELDRARVVVTTLGAAFLSGASGTCEVPDFPTPGESVTLVWQEARQHFVMTDGRTPPRFSSTGASPTPGFLEHPAANSWQSGIGLLAGWVCEAEEVVLEINGVPTPVPYGLARPDTEAVCGDTDNGFGRVFNWEDLGTGEHEVVALADGVMVDRATVWVKAWEIPPEAEGMCTVKDFPAPGNTVTLTWHDAQQQFVFTNTP